MPKSTVTPSEMIDAIRDKQTFRDVAVAALRSATPEDICEHLSIEREEYAKSLRHRIDRIARRCVVSQN
jgi:hypothetical protein